MKRFDPFNFIKWVIFGFIIVGFFIVLVLFLDGFLSA